MSPALIINTVSLSPGAPIDPIFEFAGRCVFAICSKGDFEIKILNERYRVSENCIFACMPFVNIEVMSVNSSSEIVFGMILIKDVPRLINGYVSINNLSAIQSHPLVKIQENQAMLILSAISEYSNNYGEKESGVYANICYQIQEDILDLQARLIVAKVLRAYFTNISIEHREFAPRDVEFQRFMIALYSHFKEHRDVKFYSSCSGVSEKYFSTLIRELSGSTPSEWIETVVVGEAKAMLGNSQRSIKEIASSLNFPDAPTFTKYFQRVTGMTPKAYRKNL